MNEWVNEWMNMFLDFADFSLEYLFKIYAEREFKEIQMSEGFYC